MTPPPTTSWMKTWNWCSSTLGRLQPFGTCPSASVAVAPEGWIKHLWQCLDDTPLSLKGPSLAEQPLRDNDVFLMDAFVDQGYEGEDLCLLNDCRLHIRATRLSQITTADGWRIEPRAWKGQSSWNMTSGPWIGTYRPPPLRNGNSGKRPSGQPSCNPTQKLLFFGTS